MAVDLLWYDLLGRFVFLLDTWGVQFDIDRARKTAPGDVFVLCEMNSNEVEVLCEVMNAYGCRVFTWTSKTSTFNLESFIAHGIAPKKMRRLSYGVNLERFKPVWAPDPDRFDILFVGATSLRKGLPYLLEAYRQIQHARKSLTLVGSPDEPVLTLMKKHGLWSADIVVAGPLPQPRLKEVMSRSHVMVVPSVEEGLALVQAEAMACGCPVIGTDHTGAADLFEDGTEGFIVPIRRADMIAQRLQQLAGDPPQREQMSAACLARVRQLGGWQDYGARAFATYESLVA
jgi:glycosyltransferase involved in cell wall biosynthesis